MRKRIKILRQKDAGSAPYHQTILYETEEANATVATALHAQEDWKKEDGSPFADAPVRWECSCLQKKCGACAMRINGVPRLACDAKLAEFSGDLVLLEPLKKFPVVADLIVDRTEMLEQLKTLAVWLEGEARHSEKQDAIAYEASRCLQCGCCLEVCPNFLCEKTKERVPYSHAHADQKDLFAGMAAMASLSRILAEVSDEEKQEVAKNYRAGIYNGCGKSLACRNVCPAGIDLESLMVRSNAAAVWRQWFRNQK